MSKLLTDEHEGVQQAHDVRVVVEALADAQVGVARRVHVGHPWRHVHEPRGQDDHLDGRQHGRDHQLALGARVSASGEQALTL